MSEKLGAGFRFAIGFPPVARWGARLPTHFPAGSPGDPAGAHDGRYGPLTQSVCHGPVQSGDFIVEMVTQAVVHRLQLQWCWLLSMQLQAAGLSLHLQLQVQ